MELPSQGELLADKYRVGATLGSGGFGRVVRAEDIVTGRKVAVKILKPTAQSLTSSQRFLREMRAIAQLESPHTLTLFDYGRTASGLLYMVTELVDGHDLSELLVRRERLSAGDSVHILLQVLYSLREAHSHGLIHRDIKPSNIRLYRFNDDPHRVKVLDFGLARSFEDDSTRVTKTGHVIGTPRYMSPEQLNGLTLSPATDVYSAGLVALEMLEGRAAMMDKLNSPTRIRVTRSAGVPEELAVVIERMIERATAQRYGSAQEVVTDLRPIRQAFALPSPPTPAAAPPPPRIAQPIQPPSAESREPRTKIRPVAGAVLVAGAAVGVIALWPTSVEPPPPARTKTLPKALVTTPTKSASEPAPPEDPFSRPICGGRPPPFVGVGSLKRVGGIDSHSAYIPKGYDGERRFGVLLHHHRPKSDRLLLGDKVVDLPNEKASPWPIDVSIVRQIADELDLVVVTLRIDPERYVGMVNAAIDAAAENLCVDAKDVWVLSAELDLPVGHHGWCSTPVAGTISLGEDGVSTKFGCNVSTLRFHAIRPLTGKVSAKSRERQADTWSNVDQCKGIAVALGLRCKARECDPAAQFCERSDRGFGLKVEHAPKIVDFIQTARARRSGEN